VSFRYLSSPTALDLLNYYFPHIYLWIVYLIIFFSMYFRSLSPISLLRKTLSKDVLVLSELEFLHPMCSCPTFFFISRFFLHLLCMFVLPACWYAALCVYASHLHATPVSTPIRLFLGRSLSHTLHELMYKKCCRQPTVQIYRKSVSLSKKLCQSAWSIRSVQQSTF
jgi:hypothetical protein